MSETKHILRKPAAQAKLGCRKWMFDKHRRHPQFPKPIPLGKRAIGWIESELDDYITLLAAEREGGRT